MVGNVAKEVHTMSEDSASHKWMVYVRSAPGSLSLDRHVSKVRFYLHPSYKPHDVITVTWVSYAFTYNQFFTLLNQRSCDMISTNLWRKIGIKKENKRDNVQGEFLLTPLTLPVCSKHKKFLRGSMFDTQLLTCNISALVFFFNIT